MTSKKGKISKNVKGGGKTFMSGHNIYPWLADMMDNLSDCNEIKCDGEKGSKKLFYLEIYLKGFNTLFESN